MTMAVVLKDGALFYRWIVWHYAANSTLLEYRHFYAALNTLRTVFVLRLSFAAICRMLLPCSRSL